MSRKSTWMARPHTHTRHASTNNSKNAYYEIVTSLPMCQTLHCFPGLLVCVPITLHERCKMSMHFKEVGVSMGFYNFVNGIGDRFWHRTVVEVDS